ncbi:MAG: phosphoketolase family protein [Thermomicrobiales bacterium]
MSDLEATERFFRAANYLAAAQIYLADNALLERPLQFSDVKPRLLGHWGTCPGINLVWAGLNRLLVEDPAANMMMVVGPGHGAASPLAAMFLDGTLEAIYPQYVRNREGLAAFVRAFSWPGGFPSHLNPATPGTIVEGGELGYALATAFGAVLDNPDLTAVCMVGDGEAETGPTATAWHSVKWLDPASNGAVLPILHLNGFKISSPTVFRAMSEPELIDLFRGFGWDPRIVGDESWESDVPQGVAGIHAALRDATAQIASIQDDARSHPRANRWPWPMLILRTPKGWTGPKWVDGQRIEGTFRAHQVPAGAARTNPEHLAILEAWLRSYHPETLFNKDGSPAADIVAAAPIGDRRLGMNPATRGWTQTTALERPSIAEFGLDLDGRGGRDASALRSVGAFLAEVFRSNATRKNFRIVCPDETESNQLGAVFDATGRAFAWPVSEEDARDARLQLDGRVMEVLSEHNCLGWLQGYLQTGRHGVFPCYEAFVLVVDSMVGQYAKWLKLCQETPWRQPVPSLNILLTSDTWRQDHNGYSHQGPGFINSLLQKKSSISRIYLPPDANTLLCAMNHVLGSHGYINLILATKQPLPQWLTREEADLHAARGLSIWPWASTCRDEPPDIVIASAGNVLTVEALAATQILREELPALRIRFVNVMDLMSLATPRVHPHGISDETFVDIFTWDRPVVFNFAGYPSAVHQLVYKRPNSERFHVRGYIEEGTTTTPFDMLLRNGTSRWQLVILALQHCPEYMVEAAPIVARYQTKIAEHRFHVEAYGEDPPEIRNWRWHGDAAPVR